MQIEIIFNELLSTYSEVEYVKEIRSGKEASVHLIKADGENFALKIYKENQKYSSKHDYLGIGEIGDQRMARAMKNKTNKGKDSFMAEWTQREFKIMRMLSQLSSNIPKVYLFGKDYLLMEFIGENDVPAPRLSDVELSNSEAQQCLEEIIDCLNLFIDQDFVHGDFSEYNILWFKGHPVVIDFPQVLNISKNPNCYQKFSQDIKNIEKYFEEFKIPDLSRDIQKLYEKFWEKKTYG